MEPEDENARLLAGSAVHARESIASSDNARAVPRTLVLNALALFVAESARGLFLSSLFGYVSAFKSGSSAAASSLALAVSCFSWGRLLAAFLLPVAIARGQTYRNVLLFCCLIQIAGHMMFLLPAFRTMDSYGSALVIASRAFVGLGSGTLSIARAVVSEISTIEDRATTMAWLSFAKYAGYALCPGVGILLAYADAGPLFNSFTAPAVVSIVMCLATVAGLHLWFDPHLSQAAKPTAPTTAQPMPHRPTPFISSALPVSIADRVRGVWAELRAVGSDTVLQALLLFIWLNFTTKGILAVAEASIAPQYADTFGPGGDADNDLDQDTAELALGLGVAGLITYAVMALKPKPRARPANAGVGFVEPTWRASFAQMLARAGLGSRSADVWLMLGSLACTGIGLLLMSPQPGSQPATLPSLASGLVFVWSITAPVLDVLTVSCFSVLCSTERPGAGQSTQMGYLSAAGAVGRIAFTALLSASTLSSALVACQVSVVLGIVFTVVYYLNRGELGVGRSGTKAAPLALPR